MNIAYFTPLSDNNPALQEYCINLSYNLSKNFKLSVFIDKYHQADKFQGDFNVYSFEKFEYLNTRDEFDLILYDMADKIEHSYIYPFIKRFPGIIVLHDYACHQIYRGFEASDNYESFYLKELTKNYGNSSNSIAFRYDNKIWTEIDDFLYPNNSEIIYNSLGIIVHNDIIKNRIVDEYPDIKVRHINFAIETHDFNYEKQDAKERMNIEYFLFVFGIFPCNGKIDKLDIALRGFKELVQKFPDSLLLIVGEIQEKSIHNTIDELDIWEKIKFIDPSKQNIFNCMLATDIAFEFSNPITKNAHMKMLKLMALSTPVAIFNYPPFNDIPNDCCIKIDTLVGDTIPENIFNSISPVIVNHKLRNKLGQNAKNYISEYHSYKRVAEEYNVFIKEIYQNRLSNKKLSLFNCTIDQIISEGKKIGITDIEILLKQIIQAKNELCS